MLFFVRTTKGLGDSVVYARIKNALGQFWNFAELVWEISETISCKIFLLEYSDADPDESLYMKGADIPPGGPWIEEAVDSTDNSVLAFDNNVMGELLVVPDSASTIQEKLEFIFQYLAGPRSATSAVETMYKNDGTVLSTSHLADDGTTFTKTKVQ